MGVYNIIFTEQEKTQYLKALLQELENGEDRVTHLEEKIGVSKTTIKKLKQQLIDERCNYRRSDRKSSRRKKRK